MAAQNPPSFVLTVVGESGPWSLANAFVKPVSGRGDGLIVESVVALDRYWKALSEMYGSKDDSCSVATLHEDALDSLPKAKVKNFDAVLDETVNKAFPDTE